MGVKFGSTCTRNKRTPRIPEARACSKKPDPRNDAEVAHNTRAALVHPSIPNTKHVTSTANSGDKLRGISARTVINKNSQGSDRNKSVTAIAIRAHAPPRYPASPPTRAAIRVEIKAAAGASSNEILVP